MVRPFIFPALTIWGTRGTLVLCLSERQPFFAALTRRGSCALRSARIRGAHRGAKRKDNLRFSFLFELLPFPCFLIWRRPETGNSSEKGNGSRVTVTFVS